MPRSQPDHPRDGEPRVEIVYGRRRRERHPDVYVAALDRGLRPLFRKQVNPPDKGAHNSCSRRRPPTRSTGALWACWYDTTFDPHARRAWFTCSASHDGRSWTPPERAADAPTQVADLFTDSGPHGFWPTVVAVGGVAHAFWIEIDPDGFRTADLHGGAAGAGGVRHPSEVEPDRPENADCGAGDIVPPLLWQRPRSTHLAAPRPPRGHEARAREAVTCPSSCLRSHGRSPSRSATTPSSSISTGRRGTTSPSRRCTEASGAGSSCSARSGATDDWQRAARRALLTPRRLRRARRRVRLDCSRRRARATSRQLAPGSRRRRVASRGRALRPAAAHRRPSARHPLRRRAGQPAPPDRRRARRARRARRSRGARGAVGAGGGGGVRHRSRSSSCSRCRPACPPSRSRTRSCAQSAPACATRSVSRTCLRSFATPMAGSTPERRSAGVSRRWNAPAPCSCATSTACSTRSSSARAATCCRARRRSGASRTTAFRTPRTLTAAARGPGTTTGCSCRCTTASAR